MAFDESTLEDSGPPPPEDAQNRTFIILAAALGGVFVLGLICIGIYALFIGPNTRRTAATQAAMINATNAQILTQRVLPTSTPTVNQTATALSIAQTAAARATSTPVVAATDTPIPTSTNTPVIGPATEGPAALTATARAGGSLTPTPLVGGLRTPTPARTPTPTRLPSTGFADETGVPGLIMLGFALLAVVIVARRLRLGLR